MCKVEEKVDWIDFHKMYCFPTHGYGTTILIFADGRLDEMESNTWFQSEPEDLVATIVAPGIANMETGDYLDDWVEYDQDSDRYIVADFMPDAGKVLTFKEAVLDSIENGEWIEAIEIWKCSIRAQV